MEKIVFLKSRESIFIGLIVFIIMIILALPILVLLFLRFLYRNILAIKEQTAVPEKITYKLERLY